MFVCAGEPFNNCAILDDYVIVKEPIGVGGFGTVHLATHRETKKQFAVKFMDISSNSKYSQSFSHYKRILVFQCRRQMESLRSTRRHRAS